MPSCEEDDIRFSHTTMLIPFSKSNLPNQHFINNEYASSKGEKTITIYDPKDGALVANDVPIAGEEDVDFAVSCAEMAFPAWRKVMPMERRAILLKFAQLLEEHAIILGDIGRAAIGSTKAFSGMEIGGAVEGIRYYAGWVDKFVGESIPQDDGFLKIVRNEPLGVTAAIVPWNGPLITLGLKAAPALITGNCFILKPSEKAPFAPLALGPLIKAAGFPPGVFQVIGGDGSTGALLSSHMRIRKISFTGSIATGKKIQKMAAESNLKRVTLELGGKSPAVIFDDCNLENAVMWVVNGITVNSGQACFAASKVYIQEGIYDKFLKKYISAMHEKAASIGDPDMETTGLGPLVDKAQFDRVRGFIERGRNGQGTLAAGGSQVGNKVSLHCGTQSIWHIYRSKRGYYYTRRANILGN